MAQKKMDARMDLMEQELEMVKEQLQKILGIERTLEQMSQNLVRSLQLLEDTQRLVTVMAGQKGTPIDKRRGDKLMGKGSEGSAQNKEKTLDHSGVAEIGQGGRKEGPSLVGGG